MNCSGTKNWVSTPTRSTAIASNPGHCLWSGIVPTDRAARLVARLMQPDMWSGIRTLSASGAVWPHDNAIIALGFRRYVYSQKIQTMAKLGVIRRRGTLTVSGYRRGLARDDAVEPG